MMARIVLEDKTTYVDDVNKLVVQDRCLLVGSGRELKTKAVFNFDIVRYAELVESSGEEKSDA